VAEGCAEWQGLLAEHAITGATAPEPVALGAHLDGCPRCREELVELRRVVAALAFADPDRLVEDVQRPLPGLEKVLSRVGAERARRTRLRGRTSLAVAAAAVLAVLLAVGVLGHRGAGPESGDQVAFAGAPPGVAASARLDDRPWGTAIRLMVSGLPPGQVHSVWLEDPSGHRTSAGTFTPLPGRTLTVQLASAGRRTAGVALGVSDDQGRTVLRTPIPPGRP